MAKRVSLKGKGADIFFGDYQGASSEDAQPTEITESTTEPPAEGSARSRPRRQARNKLNTTSVQSPIQADKAPAAGSPPSQGSQGSTEPQSIAPQLASTTDSTLASTLAQYPNGMVATIRKIVRAPGREVSFVRLTTEEKQQLGEIVYSYKRQGRKTSENEVNRIAVNFILEDYRLNGQNSILARVMDALLA